MKKNILFLILVVATQTVVAQSSVEPVLTLESTAFICSTGFTSTIDHLPANARITHYQWDFGDGKSSNETHPIHVYGDNGKYDVGLSIRYEDNGVVSSLSAHKKISVKNDDQKNMWTKSIISVSTPVKNKMLSCSVSTFSDVWLQNVDPLQGSNYHKGIQGVWRADANYSYYTNRNQSLDFNTVENGSYTLDQFSWEHGALEAVPHWIKTKVIAAYNTSGNITESIDTIGVHTATVYDESGWFPVAIAVNASRREIAFTSFENIEEKGGSWRFSNQKTASVKTFTIAMADRNLAVVMATMKELEQADKLSIAGMDLQGFTQFNVITDNEIVCKQSYVDNPQWSVVVFRQPLFDNAWKGSVSMNEKTSLEIATIDRTFAHTGKSSLRIMADQSFEHHNIKLVPGKSYTVEGWLSTGNQHASTNIPDAGLGIVLQLKATDGSVIKSSSLVPSGKMIDGWQQIRGAITCSQDNTYLAVQFKRGTAQQVWFDDLRLFPQEGSMKAFVYDQKNYSLQASLDEQNFATFYFYNENGSVQLLNKETAHGIRTISESVANNPVLTQK